MPGKRQKRPATSPLSEESSPTVIPPPSPNPPPVRELAMDVSMNAKLDFICSKLEKIDVLEQKFDAFGQQISSIESALHDLKLENTQLREDLSKKDKEIRSLSEQVNRLDQVSRSSSVRILGLPITASTPATDVNKIVFNEVLHPIFEAAKKSGELPNTSYAPHFLINNAFALPAKKGTSCPVILTLSSQFVRGLIFKYKKTALPATHDPVQKRDRPKYLVFEDLSPANFQQLRAIAADRDRVKSVWSFGGQLRFKMHNSETVYKVKSLADTVDSVTSPTSMGT